MRFLKSRNVLFIGFSIVIIFAFYPDLLNLIVRSIHDPINDYILVIPFVSGFFFYLNRKEIFSPKGDLYRGGLILIFLGLALYFVGWMNATNLKENDKLSIITLSIITIWIGGFVFIYGPAASIKARFPLAFLLFMVPFPTFFMERLISILQEGSADAAFLLFNLSGVPVLREGFIFHLPNLSIQVAEQCSGIHSGIALFVTSIIAGKVFLVTGWKRVVLTLSFLPITIIKNGLRIVTLSLLGNNIDERILSSPLHREGGIPFFVLAVSFLLIVLWLLKRTEKSLYPRSA